MVRVTFCSPHLGAVDEELTLAVGGAPLDTEQRTRFYGTLVGPTFTFSRPMLDFGLVPFGFMASQVGALVNTSTVAMTYALRLDEHCAHGADISIEPATGTILPGSEAQIEVELVSSAVADYDTFILVDVEGVGEGLLTIPLVASSAGPSVHCDTAVLDYGRCFVHAPYAQPIVLTNASGMPAKFRVVDAPDSAAVADLNRAGDVLTHVEPAEGLIAANSSIELAVSLTAIRVGDLATTVAVEVAGGGGGPITIKCGCVGEGPVVSVEPLALDWGRIPVLCATGRSLVLRNESRLTADFTCALEGSMAAFACSPAAGQLAPGEAIAVEVTAELNDSVAVQDTLRVAIDGGTPVFVPLAARGRGPTIVCSQPIERVDFGAQFAARELNL